VNVERKGLVRIAKESVLFAAIFTLLVYAIDYYISKNTSPMAHYVTIFVSSLLIYLGLLYFAMRYFVRRTK